MLNCGRVKQILPSYLEQKLDQDLHQEIQEHIKFCSNCLETEQSLKKVLQWSRDLPEEEPSLDFTERVLQSISPAVKTPGKQVSVPIFRRWAWAVPVSAFAILLIFVLNYQSEKLPSQAADEQTAISTGGQELSQSASPVIVPEGPVEFVMDNWDHRSLQEYGEMTRMQRESRALFGDNQGGQLQSENWRVYVMPVVQNQMAGYRTRRPY